MIILHLLTAFGATASFDNQPEGTVARSIQENGITISDFWNGIDPPPGVLTYEQADGTLAGMAGFSPLNTLGFGGYAPGDGAAFGSFVSIDLRGPAGSNAARVEVFDFFNQNISMRMEAWRGGQIVATDTVAFNNWSPRPSLTNAHRVPLLAHPAPPLWAQACGSLMAAARAAGGSRTRARACAMRERAGPALPPAPVLRMLGVTPDSNPRSLLSPGLISAWWGRST